MTLPVLLVVHSVGGWAALMGAAFLGPRMGKFTEDGQVSALPGHNLSIATSGMSDSLDWLVWFQPRFSAGG